MAKADPRLKRAGVSGYNKPKKSHVVVAKSGGKVKTIRFGQQGVSGAGKNPTSAKQKARRKSFKARHGSNIAKGKMSAAYWADKVKW
jgi:predicted ATP-dependent Lon-type protease